MQFLVANDNGNAEQDLVINGQRISAPNVFARVGKLVNLDELNPEYVLKHIHDNLIVSVEGAIYYVGAYALSSGQRCRSITVGVDNDKGVQRYCLCEYARAYRRRGSRCVLSGERSCS